MTAGKVPRISPLGIGAMLALAALIIIPPRNCGAELMMDTHGYITLAPYIHGFNQTKGFNPGYRSEFIVFVDYFRSKRLVFYSLLGNTTIITGGGDSGMKLDKIRYSLAPGFRYVLKDWQVKCALHHECIHLISRREFSGSIWWNSLQLGLGSKGSYYLYLRDWYSRKDGNFFSLLDAQINAGYILPPDRTITSGQNHNYRSELFSLLRFHFPAAGKWEYFITLRQHLWGRRDDETEHQINITFNLFRKGINSFVGFFYSYTIYDTFTLDNTEGLGALGFRILY